MTTTANRARIVFVTGTDTGVGKTLLTGLLLRQLRQSGCRALAMKPFCSGGRHDVEFLSALQDGELSAGAMNPFYFSEPLAPLVAMRRHGRVVRLREVLQAIGSVARRCECLLVEGAGGLLAPLGPGFSAADVIARLGCEVIVAARNRLGVVNHSLLTVRVLQSVLSAQQSGARPAGYAAKCARRGAPSRPARHHGTSRVHLVLMDQALPDPSAESNPEILSELLAPVPVWRIGWLGKCPKPALVLKRDQKKIQKVLAGILDLDIVSALFFTSLKRSKRRQKKVEESC